MKFKSIENTSRKGPVPQHEKISHNKVIRAYNVFKEQTKVANLLGVGRHTVRRILKEHGVETTKYVTQEAGKRKWSAFADWLRKHPEEPLPRSIKGICEVTGLSYDTVRSYLYRCRKSMWDIIKELPPLHTVKATIVDVHGHEYPFSRLSNYSFEIDSYSMAVTLKAQVSAATKTAFVIEDFDAFIARIYSLSELSSKRGTPAKDLPSPNNQKTFSYTDTEVSQELIESVCQESLPEPDAPDTTESQ